MKQKDLIGIRYFRVDYVVIKVNKSQTAQGNGTLDFASFRDFPSKKFLRDEICKFANCEQKDIAEINIHEFKDARDYRSWKNKK